MKDLKIGDRVKVKGYGSGGETFSQTWKGSAVYLVDQVGSDRIIVRHRDTDALHWKVFPFQVRRLKPKRKAREFTIQRHPISSQWSVLSGHGHTLWSESEAIHVREVLPKRAKA